ncbi:MAG: hypothetical protein IKW74_04345, partial [Thermoguttaceae bacterium]|nr:hypothetical protein [Thermoguttaceae bacterium]
SYGKGTIQEIFPLPFRMGLLRITDASFWRPSGIPIHRWHDATENDTWGIFPNQGFEVPLTSVQKLLTGWLQDLRSSSRLDDLTVSTQIVLEQISKIKTLFEQNPNAVQENMEAIQSPLHPSVLMDGTEPQGTAPYYDPQLDRAIVFLTAPDESVTHSASAESPAPPSPDPVSEVTESLSTTSDAPVPPVSRNPLNTSNKTGTEDMAVTSEHSNPDSPSVQ